MSEVALVEDSVFAAKYKIVRCVKLGGMGAVYEVEHTGTERRHALKVMLPEFVRNAEMRERFRMEARVTKYIHHANIVEVLDAGIDEATGAPYLVMELLQGEDLRERIRKVPLKRLGATEVVEYLLQAGIALDKMHRASIIHRDLKPDNLFLAAGEEGTEVVKVLDFGIAKFVADSATQANLTRNNIMGTPLYMAPEQFMPGEKISAATDVYALGMIAFTLLVGKAYWLEEQRSAGHVIAFARVAACGPVEPASARAARYGVGLSASFDAWFSRAAAPSAEDGFPSASAAVRALADALGVPLSRTVTGPPQSVLPPPPEAVTQTSAATTLVRTVSRRPRALRGVAIALAVGAVVISLGVLRVRGGGGAVPIASGEAQSSGAIAAGAPPIISSGGPTGAVPVASPQPAAGEDTKPKAAPPIKVQENGSTEKKASSSGAGEKGAGAGRAAQGAGKQRSDVTSLMKND